MRDSDSIDYGEKRLQRRSSSTSFQDHSFSIVYRRFGFFGLGDHRNLYADSSHDSFSAFIRGLLRESLASILQLVDEQSIFRFLYPRLENPQNDPAWRKDRRDLYDFFIDRNDRVFFHSDFGGEDSHITDRNFSRYLFDSDSDETERLNATATIFFWENCRSSDQFFNKEIGKETCEKPWTRFP